MAKICDNTRPDRQTIMISATFPKAVEAAAKQWLRAGRGTPVWLPCVPFIT